MLKINMKEFWSGFIKGLGYISVVIIGYIALGISKEVVGVNTHLINIDTAIASVQKNQQYDIERWRKTEDGINKQELKYDELLGKIAELNNRIIVLETRMKIPQTK